MDPIQEPDNKVKPPPDVGLEVDPNTSLGHGEQEIVFVPIEMIDIRKLANLTDVDAYNTLLYSRHNDIETICDELLKKIVRKHNDREYHLLWTHARSTFLGKEVTAEHFWNTDGFAKKTDMVDLVNVVTLAFRDMDEAMLKRTGRRSMDACESWRRCYALWTNYVSTEYHRMKGVLDDAKETFEVDLEKFITYTRSEDIIKSLCIKRNFKSPADDWKNFDPKLRKKPRGGA